MKDVRSKDVIALHQRLRNIPSIVNHVVSTLSKMFSLAETPQSRLDELLPWNWEDSQRHNQAA